MLSKEVETLEYKAEELKEIRATLAINFKQWFRKEKSTLNNLVWILEKLTEKKDADRTHGEQDW